MIEAALTHDRRAQSVALFGLITQIVALGVTVVAWIWSQATVLAITACYLGGALPIWVVVLLVFTQRKRAQIERLETEELKKQKGLTSERIFELDDEALLVERRRLGWLNRWILPTVSILIVLYHLVVVWYWYAHYFGRPLDDPMWRHAANPSMVVWFVGFVCFACFLLSRYASGMARQAEWRLMRSAASYLTGNALGCMIVVVALSMSIYNMKWGEPLAVWCIGVTMLIVAFEVSINLILDIYRPKGISDDIRPAFDSRLLGLFTEPSGIARSIAEAVNYQFGFEVSTTWFYQLLQRSVLWLTLFMFFVLWGLSSILVVDADEQAVVERFGQRAAGPEQILGPGLHFKWPWPFEVAYRAPVRRLAHLNVWDWEANKKKKKDAHDDHGEAILWTQDHKISDETLLLVAGPRDVTASRLAPEGPMSETRSVSIALIHASALVQYRIGDLTNYLYNYRDPERIVDSIVSRVLSEFAAGTELAELIGPGRERFNAIITQKLREEVERLQLGIEIVFVALQDAHPPSTSDVAKTFQDVVSAERRKEAAIEESRGLAQRILTQTAGSVSLAESLDAAIQEMIELATDGTATEEARATSRGKVDSFFHLQGTALAIGGAEAGDGRLAGEAARVIAEARADAVNKISDIASKVRILDDEIATARAEPSLYHMRKLLDTVSQSIAGIRKYIVAADGHVVVTLETEEQKDFDFSNIESEDGAAGAVN